MWISSPSLCQLPNEIGSVVVPLLLGGKLVGEVRLIQDHTAGKWKSQDLKLGSLPPEPALSFPLAYFLFETFCGSTQRSLNIVGFIFDGHSV